MNRTMPISTVIPRYRRAVESLPNTIVARRPSFTYVRGRTRATAWSAGGIVSTGKNEPARNIIGNPIAFATAAAVSVSRTYIPRIIPRDVNWNVPARIKRIATGVMTAEPPKTSLSTANMITVETSIRNEYQMIFDASHSPFESRVVARNLKNFRVRYSAHTFVIPKSGFVSTVRPMTPGRNRSMNRRSWAVIFSVVGITTGRARATAKLNCVAAPLTAAYATPYDDCVG